MCQIQIELLEQTERLNKLESTLKRIANYDYRNEELSMPDIAMEALDGDTEEESRSCLHHKDVLIERLKLKNEELSEENQRLKLELSSCRVGLEAIKGDMK